MPKTADSIETVLCIPGHWSTFDEIGERLSSTGYSFANGILQGNDEDLTFELQIEGPDARLCDAFRVAGRHWVTPADEVSITAHTFVLYLIAVGASHRLARSCIQASAALIKAGGFAVKIESSGIAHSAETWLDLAENVHLFTAHQAFVIYLTGEETYSCGMHSLGFPDAIVTSEDSPDAVELLRIFTHYLFAEEPDIVPGQTFSVGQNEPVYRLSHEECNLYEAGDLFHNPFGLWRLTPV